MTLMDSLSRGMLSRDKHPSRSGFPPSRSIDHSRAGDAEGPASHALTLPRFLMQGSFRSLNGS
jgi:hypothetical protein